MCFWYGDKCGWSGRFVSLVSGGLPEISLNNGAYLFHISPEYCALIQDLFFGGEAVIAPHTSHTRALGVGAVHAKCGGRGSSHSRRVAGDFIY